MVQRPSRTIKPSHGCTEPPRGFEPTPIPQPFSFYYNLQTTIEHNPPLTIQLCHSLMVKLHRSSVTALQSCHGPVQLYNRHGPAYNQSHALTIPLQTTIQPATTAPRLAALSFTLYPPGRPKGGPILPTRGRLNCRRVGEGPSGILRDPEAGLNRGGSPWGEVPE